MRRASARRQPRRRVRIERGGGTAPIAALRPRVAARFRTRRGCSSRGGEARRLTVVAGRAADGGRGASSAGRAMSSGRRAPRWAGSAGVGDRRVPWRGRGAASTAPCCRALHAQAARVSATAASRGAGAAPRRGPCRRAPSCAGRGFADRRRDPCRASRRAASPIQSGRRRAGQPGTRAEVEGPAPTPRPGSAAG